MTPESKHSERLVLLARPAIADEISLRECAELTGASTELLERLIEEEIIQASRESDAGLFFTRAEFEILERSLRLHHELGVNLAGIVIIHRLLQRLQVRQQKGGSQTSEAEFES